MTRSSTRYQARIRGVALGSLVAALSVAGVVATSQLAIDAAGAQTAHSTKTVVIATSSSAKLGTYLVSGGRTLYILNKKACAGQCLTYWPPVELSSASSSARAGAGVAASKLGKVKDAARNAHDNAVAKQQADAELEHVDRAVVITGDRNIL